MMAESKNNWTSHYVSQVAIGSPNGTKGADFTEAEAASSAPPVEKGENECVMHLGGGILENSCRSKESGVGVIDAKHEPDNFLVKKLAGSDCSRTRFLKRK
jgi:hypothetical protein